MKAEILFEEMAITVDVVAPIIEVNTRSRNPTINIIGKVGLPGQKGDKGDKGDAGEPVELQSTGSVIQWKYENETSWEDLMDVGVLLDDTVEEIVTKEISEAMSKYAQIKIVNALPQDNIDPFALYIVKNGGIA